ncbi:MAG: amidohydrolase [Ktedonobacteraceae bacterium]
MLDFPIIDAHVHLWDPTHFRMPWIDGIPLFNKVYGLADYQAHSEGIAIEGIVYVEVDVDPHYALLEAQWVAQRAREDPRLLGIVAHAPLEDGERVRTYLDALVAIGPQIKGVRRLVQSEPDEQFSLRPDFLRGTQLLAEYGLSCDICIRHQQLASVIDFVRLCPDTAFILDHLGKPAIKAHTLDPWREQIRELASHPNVMCKISGMVTEADHQHWTPDDLAPYVAHIVDTFGEDRIVFGGDWPVALQATSYTRWIETLDALTAHLSMQARQKLWSQNARRFYHLDGG